MSMQVTREQVWVAEIEDKAGGLAEKLTPLAEAGVNLGFVIARRNDDKAGKGVVFITPILGDRQRNAAIVAGFHASEHMHGVRAEGHDRAGLGEVVTQALAEAGINLRGLSAASSEGRCVVHLALDSESDANSAVSGKAHPLRRVGTHGPEAVGFPVVLQAVRGCLREVTRAPASAARARVGGRCRNG